MNDRLDVLESEDCPRGYTAGANPPNPANPASVLCTKDDDELVKVGTGASAFWIDRYEASVWNDAVPPVQFGENGDDYPVTFPDTGEWTAPLYALSKEGVAPSVSITWFQAEEACRLSGKRLPNGAEWVTAAKGTVDPGSSSGAGGNCVTSSGSFRNSGGGTSCRSFWGAEDMVGNVWEITQEWIVSAPQTSTSIPPAFPWPTSGVTGSFGGDRVVSDGYATDALDVNVYQLPGGQARGGSAENQAGSGRFALAGGGAVSRSGSHFGFRCVLSR